MNTRIVAIANQKGGVGKTTTAVNLAACLVERRMNVLLIDLDPQANATSGLGIEKAPGASAYRALLDGGDLRPLVRKTAYRRFDLVPSEIDLAGAEQELGSAEGYPLQLRRALEPLRAEGHYDVVLIDCPPSLGVLTMLALAAADGVLIPLQCEYYALEGLSTIAHVIGEVRDRGLNPALDIAGIVMTMYTSRTKLSKQVVEEVVRHFPDRVFETLIPRTVRLSEAPSYGKPVIVYDRQCTGATAYRLLAREFIRRLWPETAPAAAADAPSGPASPPAPESAAVSAEAIPAAVAEAAPATPAVPAELPAVGLSVAPSAPPAEAPEPAEVPAPPSSETSA